MGQPVIALPSISEDDENLADIEPIISLSPHLSSLGRSPLHSSGSPSRNLKLLNRGKSLVALRERVERQRSLNAPIADDIQSNSLDGLNLERGSPYQMQRRPSIDRLDTQVSALHEDVATLSSEVRNAIQALQQMSIATMASRGDLQMQNTRSIPNMMGEAEVRSSQTALRTNAAAATTVMLSPSSVLPGASIPRSSSQPTDMWISRGSGDEEIAQSTVAPDQLRAYILGNREEVLRLLGVDNTPAVPVALNSIPEATPRSTSNDFIYGGTTGVWTSATGVPPTEPAAQSSSTDEQDADGSIVVGLDRPQLTIVNESSIANGTPMPRSRSERLSRHHGNAVRLMPRTSASDAEVNVMRRQHECTHQLQTAVAAPSSRRSSWRDSNISYRSMQFDENASENCHYQQGPHTIVVDHAAVCDGPQSICIEPHDVDHSEMSSLIGNEMRHPATDASTVADAATIGTSASGVDRHHLAPRQRVNYRFSAGDADKLERGIRTIASTHSLRDN